MHVFVRWVLFFIEDRAFAESRAHRGSHTFSLGSISSETLSSPAWPSHWGKLSLKLPPPHCRLPVGQAYRIRWMIGGNR